MSALIERGRGWLLSFVTAEVSSRPLGMFRIFATFILIWQLAAKFVSHSLMHMPGAMPLVWVFFISGFMLLVGYKTRYAAVVFALSFAIIRNYYGHHFGTYKLYKPVQEFQVAVLLAFLPCGRSLSIDRALEVRAAEREGRAAQAEIIPWWMIEVIILQICVVYFWAALDKTDPQWLRGERMERYFVEWYGSSDTFVYSDLLHPFALASAWGTTILEFILVVGLLYRRTRPYLVWAGFSLHLGILVAFSVTYFSFMMLLILCLCLPPRWVHDFIDLVIADAPGQEPAQLGPAREEGARDLAPGANEDLAPATAG